MAIKPKAERTWKKPVIDLSGPQGNAFFLLGYAESLCKQLDMDAFKVTEEMKEGDYEHLIQTFDEYFGHVVDLQR